MRKCKVTPIIVISQEVKLRDRRHFSNTPFPWRVLITDLVLHSLRTFAKAPRGAFLGPASKWYFETARIMSAKGALPDAVAFGNAARPNGLEPACLESVLFGFMTLSFC